MSGAGQQLGPFPTTLWTLVEDAAHGDSEAAREALSLLLARYLPALRAHLVLEKRLSADQSDDLLQDFVTTKVLEQNLFAAADQQRGRFRTFLLAALNNHLLNRLRSESAQKRSPGENKLASLDEAQGIPGSVPGGPFELEWAKTVIREAVERMRRECNESGRPDLWALFEVRVLKPAMEGVQPLSYQSMVDQFAFDSPRQASNALITAKRMFARMLRSVVAEYALSEEEIEEELREMRAILSAPRA